MNLSPPLNFSKNDLLKDYWGYVKRAVTSYADRDLIVTRHGSLSFTDANGKSNSISQAIKSVLKGPKVGVGIFLVDPLEVVPCIIGVLKASDYFFVLDITFPQETLQSMLRDSEAKIILTSNRFVKKVKQLAGNEIRVINIDEIDFKKTVVDPVVNFSPDDLVQILFTSGSTGQPKGAIEDYRYLIRAVYQKIVNHSYVPLDRALQLSRFTFSATHLYIFCALLMGISVNYFDLKEEGFIGLPEWIQKRGITIFQSNVTNFRNLVAVLKPGEKFPTVQTVEVGGEKRLLKDIQAIKERFPNAKKIYMGFAATETQAVSSSIFTPDYDFEQHPLTCGKPYGELKVFIWDETGKALPVGEEGEIVVYGNSLARGYINRPELTREKFIPDPKDPLFQYYKTGDLGKMLPNGHLVHIGRIDNMVKLKGVRIELDSIENCLLTYPGIVQVVSKAIEDAKGNKRLATYFVTEKKVDLPISDLRRHLAEKLPAHYLPHYLIGLKEIPVTSNGKVSLSQLPMPLFERPPLGNPVVLPGNEIETRLLEIWEELLGIKGVGTMDDFYEVGGDSLLGVLLFVSIEKEFGRSLPVSTLLKAPTIRLQADILTKPDVSEDFVPMIPFNTSGTNPPVFFIPGKGGYPTRIRHLLKKLDPQTPLYALQDLLENRTDNERRTVEAVATFYLKEIKKLFPHGPYLLIGESLGGKIAYEIAQQLRQNGEPEPLLILLDTYNFEDSAIEVLISRKKIPYYKMLIQKHFSILARSDWKGKKEYIRFYHETFWGKVKSFVKRNVFRNNIKHSVALPENIQKLEIENRLSTHAYEVKSYPGQVILVKALRGPNAKDPTNGWDKVKIGKLIIHPLDCFHGSILFEPAVSQLAEIVQSYIDKINQGIG